MAFPFTIDGATALPVLKRFMADDSGATIIEYGILISILSLTIIGAANGGFLGMKDKFLNIANVVKNG
jgi:Flp pilus assembly pilin Flp